MKSLAFAYIDMSLFKSKEPLKVEINGIFYNASINSNACYDEPGNKLRM
jgi:glycine cleavage system aminomethyltransferase T